MKLSVIIPAYNEKDTIEEVIDKVSKVELEKEIIVVDDGSTDGTTKLLEQIAERDSKLKVHLSPENRGKGAAIQAGLKGVTGDIVIIQDADLELNPEEYHRLIKPIVEGKSKVVYGSRFTRKVEGMSLFSYMGNRVVTIVTNLLYRTKLTDQATGYKVFAVEVIKSIVLQCRGFEFCSEVTAKLSRLGYKITEVPVSYVPRGKEAGKKVSYKDGFIALRILLRYRFANANKMVTTHLSDSKSGCS